MIGLKTKQADCRITFKLFHIRLQRNKALIKLYTTLPHNLIKEKLLDLIEWTFKRALKNYGSLYLDCNDRKAFFSLPLTSSTFQ